MHTRPKLIALVAAVIVSASANAQSVLPEASLLAAQAHAIGQEPMGALDYAFSRDTAVGVQWGRVLESASLLGTVQGDAMSLSDSPTQSVGVWASHRLSDTWQLAAQYSIALAANAISAGPLQAGAFALGIVGRSIFTDDDRLALTLSSPMHVAGGTRIGMPTTFADDEFAFGTGRSTASANAPVRRVTFDYGIKVSRKLSVTCVLDLNRKSPNVPGDNDSRIGVILRKKF